MTEVVAVGSGLDDAEEGPGGLYFLQSNDLDFSENFILAVRFDICVPSDAVILGATLTVTADESDDEPTNATIWGELTPNALPLPDLLPSARTRTAASAAWGPFEVWVPGTVATSPDLSSILSEITSSPEWLGCGNVVLLMEASGDREAITFDNDPEAAPRLEFTYQP